MPAAAAATEVGVVREASAPRAALALRVSRAQERAGMVGVEAEALQAVIQEEAAEDLRLEFWSLVARHRH